MSEEVVEEEVRPIAGIGTKVFGKWDASEVTCRDPGLAPYINLTTVGVPHTGGRHANAWFGKSKLSVVERYVNKLMRTGKYTGKKQGAMKAFEEALDTMAERSCGGEGEEACLNTATGIYSCASPAADGTTVRATPVGPDPACAPTRGRTNPRSATGRKRARVRGRYAGVG